MLVLSRKEGESIKIGADIDIRVVEIEGGKVRLGITAPREIGVFRSELLFKVPGKTEGNLIKEVPESLGSHSEEDGGPSPTVSGDKG